MTTTDQIDIKHTHSAVVSWARTWRFKDGNTTYSEEYTLAMPKIVYVQIHGVDHPARIEADEVKEEMGKADPVHRLLLSLDKKPVGEFKFEAVDGWWIRDE